MPSSMEASVGFCVVLGRGSSAIIKAGSVVVRTRASSERVVKVSLSSESLAEVVVSATNSSFNSEPARRDVRPTVCVKSGFETSGL